MTLKEVCCNAQPTTREILEDEFTLQWSNSPLSPTCRGYEECRWYVKVVDDALALYEKSRKHLTGLNADLVSTYPLDLFSRPCIREAILIHSGEIRPLYSREPMAVRVARLIQEIMGDEDVYNEEMDILDEAGILPGTILFRIDLLNARDA